MKQADPLPQFAYRLSREIVELTNLSVTSVVTARTDGAKPIPHHSGACRRRMLRASSSSSSPGAKVNLCV